MSHLAKADSFWAMILVGIALPIMIICAVLSEMSTGLGAVILVVPSFLAGAAYGTHRTLYPRGRKPIPDDQKVNGFGPSDARER
jgi:hypothetical protein